MNGICFSRLVITFAATFLQSKEAEGKCIFFLLSPKLKGCFCSRQVVCTKSEMNEFIFTCCLLILDSQLIGWSLSFKTN